MKNKKVYTVTVVKGLMCRKYYVELTLEKAREIAMRPEVRCVCLIEGGVS